MVAVGDGDAVALGVFAGVLVRVTVGEAPGVAVFVGG